jgi:hypothetical protein
VAVYSVNFEGTASLVTKDHLTGSLDRTAERITASIDKKFFNMKIWFIATGAGIALVVANLYKK